MAAAAGERLSFNSALAATLQDLKLTFSLRKEQRTALKSFLENKYVFRVLINYVVSVTFFIALIGCSAILLRAEGTWKTTVYPAHTANGAAPDPTSFWCGSGLPGYHVLWIPDKYLSSSKGQVALVHEGCGDEHLQGLKLFLCKVYVF